MINEDSAFGPGMMFGIPGPGPKPDRKKIKSKKKMEKGKEIEKIPTFKKFREVNESIALKDSSFEVGTKGGLIAKVKVSDSEAGPGTKAKRFSVELDIQVSEDLKKAVGGIIKQDFVLAMSPDSTGVYSVGKDIEKYMGIPEKDVVRDVKAGKENQNDAIIYGMCNLMNGAQDLYFWTNGTRLAGEAKATTPFAAVMEQISHECIHLARLILCKAIAEASGAKMDSDWASFDFGGGEYVWPAIGDPSEKVPMVKIDEEGFATTQGIIVQIIAPYFLEMASDYIPELKVMLV